MNDGDQRWPGHEVEMPKRSKTGQAVSTLSSTIRPMRATVSAVAARGHDPEDEVAVEQAPARAGRSARAR